MSISSGKNHASEDIDTIRYKNGLGSSSFLTDKAYAEQKELEALGTEMEDAVTENLTEKEKEQLIRLLKKLIDE